jgi:hypothetical protein
MIKAITGHLSDASVAPYVRGVDQRRLATEAMKRLIASRPRGEHNLAENGQQEILPGPNRGKLLK